MRISENVPVGKPVIGIEFVTAVNLVETDQRFVKPERPPVIITGIFIRKFLDVFRPEHQRVYRAQSIGNGRIESFRIDLIHYAYHIRRSHLVRRGVFRQQPTVGKEKIPYRQSMADPDDASIYKDTETFSTFSIDSFAPGMGFTVMILICACKIRSLARTRQVPVNMPFTAERGKTVEYGIPRASDDIIRNSIIGIVK